MFQLAERPNKTKTDYMTSSKDMAKVLNDPTVKVKDFFLANSEVAVVEHCRIDGFESDTESFTNVLIATFTTSLARLKLYKILKEAGERTLYFDTDSIFMIKREGESLPETGTHLGDLAPELPPGVHITAFLATGPKSYAYRLNTGEEVVHVKGIRMNSRNSKLVTYDNMLSLVLHGGKIVLPPSCQFTREKHYGNIFNRMLRKTLKMTFDKRQLRQTNDTEDQCFHDIDTVPYGY